MGRFHLCCPAMKSAPRLEHLVSQLKEYREWVRLAEEQTGKGLLTQAHEIYSLRYAGGQCGISDYYWYKLYDDEYQQGRGAPDFLGWRLQQALSLSLNPRDCVSPAWDKMEFAEIAYHENLPTPTIEAYFHHSKKLPDQLGLHLSSVEQVAHYLRHVATYPLFSKPAFSQQSIGSAYLVDYIPSNDSLKLLNGEIITIADFLMRITTCVEYGCHRPEAGNLFQLPLKLAPEIEALTGWPAICGARVICLNDLDGVKPIRALWKIASPPNHVDNFHMGLLGNLIADIDLMSGKIERVINGLWPKARVLDRHPYTGQSFADFFLPGWKKLLEICIKGAQAIPCMRIHHWDFAFTDNGPVILELNDLGGTEGMQVHGRGLLTPETRAFLKRHADIDRHAWVKSL